MRLILPSSAGLKTVVNLEEPVTDVLTARRSRPPAGAGVGRRDDRGHAEYRGTSTNGGRPGDVPGGLQLARHRDVHWVLAILDLVVLDLIQRELSPAVLDLRRDRTHELPRFAVEPPVWCNLRHYDQRLAITDPGMHEILFQSRKPPAKPPSPSRWEAEPARGTTGDHVLAATA